MLYCFLELMPQNENSSSLGSQLVCNNSSLHLWRHPNTLLWKIIRLLGSAIFQSVNRQKKTFSRALSLWLIVTYLLVNSFCSSMLCFPSLNCCISVNHYIEHVDHIDHHVEHHTATKNLPELSSGCSSGSN